MSFRYLTVLVLWALFGAFVCQYETAPDSTLPPESKEEGSVSRRDLALNMRDAKAVRLIYPVADAAAYQPLIEKTGQSFPKDWQIELINEQDLRKVHLQGISLIIIGRSFQHPDLVQLLTALPFAEGPDHFWFHEEKYDQPDHSYRLFLYPNPESPTPVFLIGGNTTEAILTQLAKEDHENWTNLFWRSWGYEIFQKDQVIVRGNFADHSWTFQPDNHFDFTRQTVANLDSEHFQFHDLADLGRDYVEQLAAACEAQIQALRTFTGSEAPVPTIDYYIYPTIEEKGLRLMNTEEGHLIREHREVHVVINTTFQGQHTHRDLKLILHDLLGEAGKPFLAEGLPTYFNAQWQEKGADYWAARLYHSGNLPPLREILDDASFERESPLVMTAAAGSLVSFLIDHWGKMDFLRRYREWVSPSEPEIQAMEEGWHHYLAGLAVGTPSVRPNALPYYRGFNFAHEGYQIYNGYGSKLAQQSLEKLSQLGTNAVAIVPYGFQRDPEQASFLSVHHRAGSENDESVIYSHAQAQELGMYTLLKPQLWVSGSWPGDVNMSNEGEWDAFFDYYYRWIRHYALMAEIRRFDAFCIGVEFSKATLSHPDAWRSMIRRIRGLYSGPITYAANWGEEFEQLSFWDELDFIGLNCYYPLSKDERPAKSELQRNFDEVLQRAEKVSERFHKPLVFTEVGFRSVTETWKNPHAEAAGRPYDPECQRLCYEVLFEGIANQHWINGLFIWKWPSYLSYQQANPVGFTPNGKPAEAVVQRWFGR